MRRRTIKGREFGLASVPPEIFLRSDKDRGNKERTKSELDHISLGRQLTYVKGALDLTAVKYFDYSNSELS